jgi:hypothetical protein
MKTYKEMVEAKDWKSLPDDYWVLVQGRKVIKSGKTKPKFTSSKGQELMTVKYAKKMMMEQKTFAPKQIDKLRKEYGNIGKMTYEQGEKLKNMVSKYPKEVLQQLAKEDIPWISMFAALRLKK